MSASGDSVSSVSDPRVQAALERIADSAGIDLNAMPDVLEDVYRRLNAALADSSPSGQTSASGTAGQLGGAPNAEDHSAGPDAMRSDAMRSDAMRPEAGG